MKTLHCMHQEDWMCSHCCKCTMCCECDPIGVEALVHVNSLAAANAWRRTMREQQIDLKLGEK